MDPELLAFLFAGGGAGLPVIPPPMPTSAPVVPVPTPTTMGTPQQEPYRSELMPASGMMPRPQEDYRTQPAGLPTTSVPMPMPRPSNLGAALDGGGGYAGNPWSPGGIGDASAAMGSSPRVGSSNALLQSLRGVQAPAAPTPQKVSTPHAPQLRPIQGGGFADLLASLGIGPQQALPGLKLPSTLGRALAGGVG